MWELICHHTYKWQGRPVDVSRYNNPAETAGGVFSADGIAPGSGAWRFVKSNAHVHVPPGPGWSPLGAIKVELTVRLTDPSAYPQVLIQADQSFGVFVKHQILFGFFVGNSIYPGMTSDGFNTFQDGMDSPGYRLPFGAWTTITFHHDGASQMRLYADGVPVTVARPILAAVPPVGPKGVSIGNGLGGGMPFGGDIDEVKVWRVDPNTEFLDFIARPMDRPTIDCWARFRDDLARALAQHPDCARKLDADFTALLHQLAQAVRAKGPESQQRLADVQKEFRRLWQQGRLNGPEMTRLINDWLTWLRLVGGPGTSDSAVLAFQQAPCLQLLLGELKIPDCDPQLAALLQLVGAAGRSSSQMEASAS